MLHFLRIFGVLLVITPHVLFAQDVILTKLDISRLATLYEQQQRQPNDEYTQQLIADERNDLRNLIEDELSGTFSPVYDEEILDTEEDLTKAVDRQRAVISAIEERIRDRKVDLELLQKEESIYYKAQAGTGATSTNFRLTKTYPELLAKKAVLEERIAVLESLRNLQNARLEQLVYDQRIQHFRVLITVGTYVLIILVILFLEKLIRKRLLSRISDLDKRYSITKTFTSSVYILVSVWILGVIFSKQPQLLASLAIVGAGLAIALQDIVKDIVGWFIIMQHRLFNRGHRISVGTITGEVIDYGLMRTVLLEIGLPGKNDSGAVLERTGKVLSIPNAVFLNSSITNHTTSSDFVRAEMRITVTFESNWRKAHEICQSIVDEVTSEYVDRDQRQTGYRMQMLYLPRRTSGNQVYYDIAADGVELTMRFTVPIGERRPTVSLLSDRILEAIQKEPEVELAYATQRVLAEFSQNLPES